MVRPFPKLHWPHLGFGESKEGQPKDEGQAVTCSETFGLDYKMISFLKIMAENSEVQRLCLSSNRIMISLIFGTLMFLKLFRCQINAK